MVLLDLSICEHFSKKGYVIGIDNRSKLAGSDVNMELINSNGANFVYCDITDQNQVEAIFKNFGEFDFIFHMASQVSFKKSIESRRDLEINLIGTFNILECLRINMHKSMLIYASTNQVYGSLEGIELIEKEKDLTLKL